MLGSVQRFFLSCVKVKIESFLRYLISLLSSKKGQGDVWFEEINGVTRVGVWQTVCTGFCSASRFWWWPCEGDGSLYMLDHGFFLSLSLLFPISYLW